MSTLRAVCLLPALFCITASADPCSGGAGGGMDVTGNECAFGRDDAYVASIALVHARLAAAFKAATLIRVPSTVRPDMYAAVMRSRAAGAVPLRVELPKSGKLPARSIYAMASASATEATCSGGANGGTDATGNECSAQDAVAVVIVDGSAVFAFRVGNKAMQSPFSGSAGFRTTDAVIR